MTAITVARLFPVRYEGKQTPVFRPVSEERESMAVSRDYRTHRVAGLLLAMLLLVVHIPSTAQAESSEWFYTDGARMRLVAQPSPLANRVDAGLEIELQDGWKTYWRNPGDSGIPPQFNFTRSRQIADIKVHYPIPRLFNDNGSISVGYKKHVVFPLEVVVGKNTASARLHLDLLVGICAEICIPVQAELSLPSLTSSISTADVARAIAFGKQGLPMAESSAFQVTRAELAGNGSKAFLVDVQLPADTASVALFVEGPPQWYLTHGKLLTLDKGAARFEVPLNSVEGNIDVAGTPILFTVVADGAGIEQQVRLAASSN
jgi:DsbC/DsbD-like thiol-disulfide interchange protein